MTDGKSATDVLVYVCVCVFKNKEYGVYLPFVELGEMSENAFLAKCIHE